MGSLPPRASQEPQQETGGVAKGPLIAYRWKQKCTGARKQADIQPYTSRVSGTRFPMVQIKNKKGGVEKKRDGLGL